MKKKSITVNAILSSLQTILAIIFPLITFPYISRVLQADNIGKINFSNSIVSYFLLIAGLGINNYAIREGSRIREKKKALTSFVNQIFTINLLSTAVAYTGLFFLLWISPDISKYQILILIQSFAILFTTLGVEWLYSIYEDYAYITIRTIMVQVLSLVLMFVFVKKASDYIMYAAITVLSSSGMYLWSFIHARKYSSIRLTRHVSWKAHFKPILILFANSVAVLIYVNSDTTILGLIRGDYEVGLYSVSVKIYAMLKQTINALVVVSLPRLSYYIAQSDMKNYKNLLNKMLKGIILFCFPAIIGLFMISKQIILLISGKDYLGATSSLKILSFAIGFSIVAAFFVNAILIPKRREKVVLITTIIGALLNIGLNIIFIPLYGQNAAAFTTLLAEAVVMIISIVASKNELKLLHIKSSIIHAVLGCIVVVGVIFLIDIYVPIPGAVIQLFLTIILSVGCYLGLLVLLKDQTAFFFINKIKKQLIFKRGI